MTEEIIIDGVNVAECCYMYDNKDLNYMCQNGVGTCICRENKNCYYKQLKRLEQENKELDNEAQEYHNTIMKLDDLVKELRQENKELKRFFDSAAKKNTNLENKMKEYHDEYDELYRTADQLVKDKTRLKQALEEINLILDELKQQYDYMADYSEIKEIQDKINEVLQ